MVRLPRRRSRLYGCTVHFVILGCGRVGSMVAGELDELGHSVAVVDLDAGAFRRLPANFTGLTVKGVGFDRETLENAGIKRAHAFAAVSSGDNTNILGQAARPGAPADALEAVFRSVVVVRGSEAMPMGSPIPLRLPDASGGPQASQAPVPPSTFERGPEITETR